MPKSQKSAGNFPQWPSSTTAPVYQQRFEHRVKASVSPGQVLLIDAYPYNDIALAAYIAPGSADNYTAFGAGTYNTDVSTASTTQGSYSFHSFAQFNSLLASFTNLTSAPTTYRQVPKMRYTSFCVEVANLSQISSLNGMLRCCRISSATQNPAQTGAAATPTAPWANCLQLFYENPETQHVVGAEASKVLCAHALPTQLLSGQFYSPTAEGLTSGAGGNATSAWSSTVYALSNTAGGGVDQDTLWTTLRFVVDSLSATANIEFIVKASVELIIPPDSFLVGVGVPRQIGNFEPVLRRAAQMARFPPITVAPGGSGRSIAGIIGIPQVSALQNGPKKTQGKKNLRTQQAPAPNHKGGNGPNMQGMKQFANAAAKAAIQAVGNGAVRAAPAVMNAAWAAQGGRRQAIGELRRRRR